MNKALQTALAAGVLALASAAHADIHQFTAQLNGANEVPPTGSPGNGLAALFYDDHGTADLGDDTFDFTLAVFGLTAPPTGYHIHGAATTSETAPVRVDLSAAPFEHFVWGNSLMVSGNDVGAMMVPETAPSATNQGHPAMSFLDMLNNGLAYVNVHSANFPAGEVRGQLMAVTAAVPEPSTYAFMLAGLAGLIGVGMRRRRS
jgi:hypothetical protein